MFDSPALTAQERDQYEKLGYFMRESVFSEAELEGFRAAAEEVHQRVLQAAEESDAAPVEQVDNQKYQEILGSTIKWEWDNDLRAVRSMEPVFQIDERFSDLIDDPRMWGPCAELTGCERLSLFSDKLNVKRPGGAPFPFHQEGPYWAYGAEDLERVVTLILYLDDATVDNGCLWVIPGSLGLFECHGAQGQRVSISPKLDLVAVRLGATPPHKVDAVVRWGKALVDVFRPTAS